MAVAGDAADLGDAAGEVQLANVECIVHSALQRELIRSVQRETPPGEIVVVAVESNSHISAHYRNKVPDAAGDVEFCLRRLP